MARKRKWEYSKRGDWYKRGGQGHGPVKLIVEDGVIVGRIVRELPVDHRDPRLIERRGSVVVEPVEPKLSKEEIERRLRSMLIRRP